MGRAKSTGRMKPMKIAAPPPVGTGRVLIRRSFGSSTSRSRTAREATSVAAHEMPSDARKTAKYFMDLAQRPIPC